MSSSILSVVGDTTVPRSNPLMILMDEYLWPNLRGEGFQRVSGRFVREANHLLYIIEIQRSIRGTAGAVRFRINYGVMSVRLAEFFGALRSELASYEVQACHWIDRAGPQSDLTGDGWWEIGAADDLPVVASDVLHVLNQVVLPAFGQLAREDDLVTLWLTGRAPGITEGQRLANLATLLVIRGQNADLPPLIAGLRARAARSPSGRFARMVLKRLEPYLTPIDK
jgi:hypothetical protein